MYCQTLKHTDSLRFRLACIGSLAHAAIVQVVQIWHTPAVTKCVVCCRLAAVSVWCVCLALEGHSVLDTIVR